VDDERADRAADLFADALERADAERDAFVAAACAGDDALRAEVLSLLAAHAPAQALFREPPRLPAAPDAAGSVFGSYRVLRLLAEGGMGEVYLAERTDAEFEKQVAIKRIRPGLGTREILERFRRERQLLADLEHPNVARLLDGGSTPDGLPYLVMEYVDGVPIDRWCGERGLSVEERLRLFLRVCDGVHYAHRNLVVHRDLKPSNILVDRAGTPKLLDFGIAKVLEAGGGAVDGAPADAAATTFRALTPRYASPEQIRGDRITTSTDVYSLGVVLYELLAGRSPYRDTATGGLERAVCEEAPTRPSRAAAAADDGATRRRRARLTGDLDNIVLRALAKDAERRYASAEDLAADIRRHLDGLPVAARPDTAAYRLSKFVRRNRGLTAAVAGVIAVLAVALSVTLDAQRRAAAGEREARFLAYTGSLAAAEASLGARRLGEAARHVAAAPAELRGFEWRHLRARLDRSERAIAAHRAGVTAIAFAPDGSRFLTGGLDSAIVLWDGAAPARRWDLEAGVESLALDDAGDVAAAGLSDGAVLILPLGEGAGHGPPHELGRGSSWAVVDVARDGTRVGAGFSDGTVRVWDAGDGKERARWAAHDRFAVVRWDRAGDRLWTGGSDGRLRAWNVGDAGPALDVRAHERRVYALAVSRDGRRVATGSMDRTAAVWDAASGARLGEFRGHEATVASLAFLADGAQVVSGGADGRTAVWNVADGAVAGELVGHVADVSAVAASFDGSRIVTGDWQGEVRTWSAGAQEVRTLPLPRVPERVLRALDVRVSPDGRRIAAATNSVSAVVFDVARGVECGRAAMDGESRAVAWSADGALLVGDHLGIVAAFDAGRFARTASVEAHRGAVRALAADATRLFTAGEDSLVRAWSLPGLGADGSFRLPAVPSSLDLSPDGRMLVTADGGGAVRWWDAASGSPLGAVADGTSPAFARFAPDGRTIVTGGEGAPLRVWSVAGAALAAEPLSGTSRALAAAFSPDGARLAVGGLDGSLHLLETSSWREVATLHGHGARIPRLDFAADGRSLASGSWDGTVRVWDAPGE